MTSTPAPETAAQKDDRVILEKKRMALNYLCEAWDEAAAEGIEPEILAHAALFRAFADLVEIYGEDAVADLARTLPARIQAFEFSVKRPVQ
ncbi:MAG: hypothetical protein GY798_08390 [Hyphomicrobiales bacterium]|nr:hypothetical protein [Hyphomicrobiales bacterium]MCP5112960.1 hypothetical protein [bacterium]